MQPLLCAAGLMKTGQTVVIIVCCWPDEDRTVIVIVCCWPDEDRTDSGHYCVLLA